MILKHALLDVIPGREAEFERAFAQAAPIIASIDGYLGHTLRRGMEQPSRYLLLVRWRALEDHTRGFRDSPQSQDWKGLLHHFYDPFRRSIITDHCS
jgi:heme-degrading monooxygenase HmoA